MRAATVTKIGHFMPRIASALLPDSRSITDCVMSTTAYNITAIRTSTPISTLVRALVSKSRFATVEFSLPIRARLEDSGNHGGEHLPHASDLPTTFSVMARPAYAAVLASATNATSET